MRVIPPSTHSFKYASFYGRPGERVALFDNERGKENRKRILKVETPYEFTTPDKLTEDFEAAVRGVQQGKGKADD